MIAIVVNTDVIKICGTFLISFALLPFSVHRAVSFQQDVCRDL